MRESWSKNFVITSSTLAGINKPKLWDPIHTVIHSVECPGARISQMLNPLVTELSGAKMFEQEIKIAMVGGLNDLMQNRSLDQIKLDVRTFKQEVKNFCPQAKIVFMALPLIPKLTVLPNDDYLIQNNRLADSLALNDFFMNIESDLSHDLSMEKLGLDLTQQSSHMAFYKDHFDITHAKFLPRKHDTQSWREASLPEGVHLKDEIRSKFWLEKVLYFFNA